MFGGTYTLVLLAAVAAIAATVTPAADLDGQIIIKHRLTRRTVTAPASAYQRGSAVPPPPAEAEDPLAFERTRVVVYLEGQLPSEPVNTTLEQVNRRFVPDLVAVPAGSTVSFPNRDVIFHNVFSFSRPKTFDLGNYPKNQTRTVTLPKEGVVYVNCHLHPNMTATIFVTPNAVRTRPDEAGRFVLRNVPPGRRTIVAWHKAAGFFRQTIDVDADHNAPISFLIPFEEDGTLAAHSQR